jgi:hypothetical protein
LEMKTAPENTASLVGMRHALSEAESTGKWLSYSPPDHFQMWGKHLQKKQTEMSFYFSSIINFASYNRFKLVYTSLHLRFRG